MPTIEEIINNTEQAIADELEEKRIQYTSLKFLIQQLPAWKRWYLKKNQPKNYFRVTRIIPPGLEETPGMWRQKFQVWIKGKLEQDYYIEQFTFDYFYNQPDWEKADSQDMASAILKPAHTQTETI